MKLLPIVTVAGGAAASSPKLKAQLTKVIQSTKVVATQQEVSDIAKLVYLDSVDGTAPKPEAFSSYLQNHMRGANGSTRNNSKDQWDQPYRLTYDQTRHELLISSAGPDGAFDTNDDITANYPLDRN